MNFPIQLEMANGEFHAQLLGAPHVHATAKTRELALAALREELAQRVEAGQLVSLDVKMVGVSELAGKYADDQTLDEICAEAYRLRDTESLE